jgi:hypothetical protein
MPTLGTVTPPQVTHETPLSTENEQTDFNFGKNKPKKPKKKSKEHIHTEAEEERQLERKKQQKNEKIQKSREKLGLKISKKHYEKEEIIVEHLSNINKIEGEYAQVYQYIKQINYIRMI